MAKQILSKTDRKFKFLKDSILFIIILLLIAIIGTSCVVKSMIKNEYADHDIFVYYLTLITITIPPTLPLALLAGLRISNNRF